MPDPEVYGLGGVYGPSGGGYSVPPGSPGPQVVNGAFVGNGAVPVGNPTSGAMGAPSLSALNAPQNNSIAQQYQASAGPVAAPPATGMPAAQATGTAATPGWLQKAQDQIGAIGRQAQAEAGGATDQQSSADMSRVMSNLAAIRAKLTAGPQQQPMPGPPQAPSTPTGTVASAEMNRPIVGADMNKPIVGATSA
jgi:hypothetical protein